jgi:IclR family pca regulon transcriptional regulator
MVYRLIRTLETHGLVRSRPDGYVLGPLAITLGQRALKVTQLPEVARLHILRLHHEFHETVNLAILDGDEIVIVEREETRGILGLRLDVGSRLPSYCTSVGHVLLAHLPESEVRRRLSQTDFKSVGPNTVRSLDQLIPRLQHVERQGYALNDEELASGHCAAAAPIYDHAECVIAALNVSVPSSRVSPRDMNVRIVPSLVACAEAISAELGSRRVVPKRDARPNSPGL